MKKLKYKKELKHILQPSLPYNLLINIFQRDMYLVLFLAIKSILFFLKLLDFTITEFKLFLYQEHLMGMIIERQFTQNYAMNQINALLKNNERIERSSTILL